MVRGRNLPFGQRRLNGRSSSLSTQAAPPRSNDPRSRQLCYSTSRPRPLSRPWAVTFGFDVRANEFARGRRDRVSIRTIFLIAVVVLPAGYFIFGILILQSHRELVFAPLNRCPRG